MKFVIVYQVKNEFGDKVTKYKYTKRPTISVKKIMNIAEFGINIFPFASSIYSLPCLCFTDKWQIKKVNDSWENVELQEGIEQIKKAINAEAIKVLK